MKRLINELLRQAGQELEFAGVPEARREAGALLSFVLGKDRTFLISHAEDLVDDYSWNRFREFVERRATGEPLQYITGVQDFYGPIPGISCPRAARPNAS